MLSKQLPPPATLKNGQYKPIPHIQRAIPNKMACGVSPPARLTPQPHKINISPSQQYMMHLVPQPDLHPVPPVFTRQENVSRPESSSFSNKFINQRSTPTTQSVLTIERPNTIIKAPNLASTQIRSRVASELTHHQSNPMLQRNQYLIPQSPSHFGRMEPVRRVSQHRLSISSADKQGQQQNIRIVIETDQAHNRVNTPNKITIQHSQAANNHILPPQGHFVTAQPTLVQMVPNPRPPSILQNHVERRIVNNLVMNEASSNAVPHLISHRLQNRAYSLDSRQLATPYPKSTSKVQIQANSKTKQRTQPDMVIQDAPSELVVQRPSCCSLDHQQQIVQTKNSQSSQYHLNKRVTNRQKKPVQNNSPQSEHANHQGYSSSKEQIFNAYYEQLGPEHNPTKQGQRKLYILEQEQKGLFASALLLNEMYENEVNKALLRMNGVQNKSREKSRRKKNQ